MPILTKDTTLFVITPPNKLLTVFFFKNKQKWVIKIGTSVQISKKHQHSGTNQFWRHFFNLSNEISKKFCHIFLLSCIQRLLIHSVCFTKRSRIICFAFTLLKEKGAGWIIKQSNIYSKKRTLSQDSWINNRTTKQGVHLQQNCFLQFHCFIFSFF